MDISTIWNALDTSQPFVLAQIELTKQFLGWKHPLHRLLCHQFTSVSLFNIALMPIAFITGLLTDSINCKAVGRASQGPLGDLWASACFDAI
ncbi:hypothetical protein V1506DRAFT_530669 [Lipomyces tetrasporus]